MTKEEVIVKDIIRLIKRHNLTYDESVLYMRKARDLMGLKPPKRNPQPEKLPTIEEVRKFLQVVEKKSVVDKLIMKLYLFTGMRNYELTNIKLKNIDLEQGKEKMWLDKRKKNAGSYILIPNCLVDNIKFHIASDPRRKYLFETSYMQKMSERTVRHKFQKYREEAGLDKHIHAHNFRHMILTYFGTSNMNQQKIMLISGHKDSKNLDIYVNGNPETVRDEFNQLINRLEMEV